MNACKLLMEMYSGAAVMKNNVEIPQIIKNRNTILMSKPTSQYRSKIIEIKIPNRYLNSHVYCSIIHNSPDVKQHKGLPMQEWIQKIWFTHTMDYCCLVAQLCPTLLGHYGLQPARLLYLWDFLGKNTGVLCHFCLQGNLLDPGIKSMSPAFLALAAGVFSTESLRKPLNGLLCMLSHLSRI